ncbi:MAG TPA: hypothetical protein VM347_01080 [Nonomuraea sp.]|nr:hypothetical protein [Nonomuraea sp.]
MALVEVAEPEPVFGEMLVKVAATGVNPVSYTRRRLPSAHPEEMPGRFLRALGVDSTAALAGLDHPKHDRQPPSTVI